HSHIDDVVIFDGTLPNPKTPFGGLYANGQEAKTQGLEFAGQYGVTDNLSVYANYTYTDSFLKRAGADWTPTVQIAKNKGNLGVTYTRGDLILGINWLLNGPRLRWAGDVSTPGYGRVDVSARYKVFDHWSLYGRIENVLNQKIIEELGYKQPRIYAVG